MATLCKIVPSALAAILSLSGCVWLANPQAGLDSFDSIRSRNERGIYFQQVNRVAALSRRAQDSMDYRLSLSDKNPETHCTFRIGRWDMPDFNGIMNLDHAQYSQKDNLITYPIGNHDMLRHEIVHAVLFKANLPFRCVDEILAILLAQDPDLGRRSRRR